MAFDAAWAAAGRPQVAAISVAGQQHGMVALDADRRPVHPAKLWNDTESAPDAAWLIDQLAARTGLDGREAFAAAVGSVPVAAFTITKLSWLHRTHPDAWARMAHVVLPHDYVTSRLTGALTTDRGDASGTGYWSPHAGEYRWDLLEIVDADRDWSATVPRVLGPGDPAGEWNGAVVGPGTGDNMAAALGVGLRPGDAVISVGTSGTVYAVSDTATADADGAVAGFADASGRFLPLVCTSNAAKVLDATRRLLGVDHAEFDALALQASSHRPVLLPYFDGERTPYLPTATGTLSGLRSDVTRADLARAAIDGVACGLLDGFDALVHHAPVSGRVLLVGGGARSRALQRVLAGMLDRPVTVVDVAEAVATGAAVQAAMVAEGAEPAAVQRRWGLGNGAPVTDAVDPGDVRDRYAELRDAALASAR